MIAPCVRACVRAHPFVLRPANSTANLARATRMPAADAKRSAEPATKDAASTYFIAGGVAGIVSRTCIAPIERVKILYQINRGSSQAWYRIPGQILHNEGVLAFWKGNTAAVVRVMPYMSLTFMSYEEYKVRCLPSWNNEHREATTVADPPFAP